jgi:hypothetical protein
LREDKWTNISSVYKHEAWPSPFVRGRSRRLWEGVVTEVKMPNTYEKGDIIIRIM